MSKVSTLSVFSDLVKETQSAIDEIVPGKVKVSVTHCDERNRYSITGDAELRMRVSYDYDPNMIIPAKAKLVKKQSQISEDITDADLLISYYKQRADYMLATDEEVLAFKGHPAMFTTS
jgi:hypothetical protein|tara:strand:+ start:2355 stop:2711 length:357 start_codon:yes stop_codon:yes gene_type:complete